MKMPTVSYISKLIRKGKPSLYRPTYGLSRAIKLNWGTKKPKSIEALYIEFGSNSFSTDIHGDRHTINEYRFDSPKDVLDLIFLGRKEKG